MKGMNNKTKIILVAVAFFLFALGMFLFGYSVMAGKNQATADEIALKKVEFDTLDREQKSFEQGKKDLAELRESTYPPDELFSSDTKVVKEIQQLESAAQRYDLDLTIQVSGATKNVVTVPGTTSGLHTVPYTINIDGSFANVMKFMQTTERLPFITHAQKFTITVGGKDIANTVISSEFYLKKPESHEAQN